MKTLFVRVLSVVTVFTLSIAFFSCKKNNDNVSNNSPVSGLMTFNLATDKAVDVALSGSSITGLPLSFTSYSGSYLTIYSGNRLVQSFDYNSRNIMDSTSFTFEPQKYYSLFVTGSNGNYRNIIVKDNYDSLSTSQAYVRYINAIPDSSAPTITISASGSDIVNTPASFRSISNFTAVSPGLVTIQIKNGSTINKTRTITLEQQKAYTVLFAGTPGSASNDSLQIRYVENGTFTEGTQKSSERAGSVDTK